MESVPLINYLQNQSKIFKNHVKWKWKGDSFGLFPESLVPSFSSVSGRGFTYREIWLSKHIFWIAFLLLVLLCFRSRKTHPGPVVHLSDNPLDANKVRWATVVEETLTVYLGLFASFNSVYRVLTFHRPSSNQFYYFLATSSLPPLISDSISWLFFGYYAVSTGQSLQTFRRTVVPSKRR